ncbi:MAG: hypothetical protein HYU52_06475 [Acidobacteria bacterium]|nr:hypothetical protein [Acidobacteriota bacterium]
MSQRNVEIVIGRLVTDEAFRRRFRESPQPALEELIGRGIELNVCELRALSGIDPERVERFAGSLHPCIQRVEIEGGHS